MRGADRLGTTSHGFFVDSTDISNSESDIFNTITTTSNLIGHFLRRLWLNRGLEYEDGVVLLDNMRCNITRTSLQTLIGDVLETEPNAVVSSGLLCVCYGKFDMVIASISAGSGINLIGSGLKETWLMI